MAVTGSKVFVQKQQLDTHATHGNSAQFVKIDVIVSMGKAVERTAMGGNPSTYGIQCY